MRKSLSVDSYFYFYYYHQTSVDAAKSKCLQVKSLYIFYIVKEKVKWTYTHGADEFF